MPPQDDQDPVLDGGEIEEADPQPLKAASDDEEPPRGENDEANVEKDDNEDQPSGEGEEDETAEPAEPKSPPLTPVEEKPLTLAAVIPNLKNIARTGTGLSHAFTRVEIKSGGWSNLEVLRSFPHLRNIDVSDNTITDASALEAQTYLLTLNLSKNKLSEIPSCLDGKKYLQLLYLDENRIKSTEKLTNLPHLRVLNLNGNRIKALTIPELADLQVLEARGNRLTNTSSILAPNLTRLYLAGNQITDLTGLSSLISLTTLHLRGNLISNLDGLSTLTNLKYLNMRQNEITSFDELYKLSSLHLLRHVVFLANPLCETEDYRLEVLIRIPKLERLDKEQITEEEREEAEQLKLDREAAKREAEEEAARIAAQNAEVKEEEGEEKGE